MPSRMFSFFEGSQTSSMPVTVSVLSASPLLRVMNLAAERGDSR